MSNEIDKVMKRISRKLDNVVGKWCCSCGRHDLMDKASLAEFKLLEYIREELEKRGDK